MGITFSQITDEGIKPALKILEKEVDTLANKSPVKYNLNLKETKTILKDTLDKLILNFLKKWLSLLKKIKK